MKKYTPTLCLLFLTCLVYSQKTNWLMYGDFGISKNVVEIHENLSSEYEFKDKVMLSWQFGGAFEYQIKEYIKLGIGLSHVVINSRLDYELPMHEFINNQIIYVGMAKHQNTFHTVSLGMPFYIKVYSKEMSYKIGFQYLRRYKVTGKAKTEVEGSGTLNNQLDGNYEINWFSDAELGFLMGYGFNVTDAISINLNAFIGWANIANDFTDFETSRMNRQLTMGLSYSL